VKIHIPEEFLKFKKALQELQGESSSDNSGSLSGSSNVKADCQIVNPPAYFSLHGTAFEGRIFPLITALAASYTFPSRKAASAALSLFAESLKVGQKTAEKLKEPIFPIGGRPPVENFIFLKALERLSFSLFPDFAVFKNRREREWAAAVGEACVKTASSQEALKAVNSVREVFGQVAVLDYQEKPSNDEN
jgi:hypothetical protein